MNRLKQIKARELVSALKQAGFIPDNQEGSHLILVNEIRNIQTSVPMHAGDIGRGLLKKILKQAKLTEKEFKKLL